VDDLFLVIASDGVWEFLSNEEVGKITSPFYYKGAPEAAANALVKESYKKWK
jgi:serine/threonine protein phosphatase PrpC